MGKVHCTASETKGRLVKPIASQAFEKERDSERWPDAPKLPLVAFNCLPLEDEAFTEAANIVHMSQVAAFCD